jgi:hypothetical protein
MEGGAPSLSRVALEPGSNDAAIVLPAVNVRKAAPQLFWAAFAANTGLICLPSSGSTCTPASTSGGAVRPRRTVAAVHVHEVVDQDDGGYGLGASAWSGDERGRPARSPNGWGGQGTSQRDTMTVIHPSTGPLTLTYRTVGVRASPGQFQLVGSPLPRSRDAESTSRL